VTVMFAVLSQHCDMVSHCVLVSTVYHRCHLCAMCHAVAYIAQLCVVFSMRQHIAYALRAICYRPSVCMSVSQTGGSVENSKGQYLKMVGHTSTVTISD